MSPRMQPFSRVIAQERRRWMPFRWALPKENQGVFDQRFAYAMLQLQAEVQLGRPRTFEAVLMAVLLEHEKRFEPRQMRLRAVRVENRPHLPDGDHPE